MTKIPYLVRRKNVFYFRLVVPIELRDPVKVREITQSLRTENRAEATHKALVLASHFKAALHDLKYELRAKNLALRNINDLCGWVLALSDFSSAKQLIFKYRI